MQKLALLGGTPLFKKTLKPCNSFGKEEVKAVTNVLKGQVLSGFLARAGNSFLGGKYVKKLEKDFCEYFNVKYAVSFNSASTALQAAVGALGVGPGDQVITSPFTMSATPSAVLWNNALPVFADISEDNFCIDPKDIEKKINKKTKAILAINLFGNSPDYRQILKIAKKQNLKVIEDNSQSPGAVSGGKLTGTIGDISVFSFNFHKAIQAGEGGILLTNNKKYAFRAQLIRNHGEAIIDDLYGENKIYEPILGSNFRLTEIQAAIVVEQLKKLKKLNQQRIALANYLTKRLECYLWLIAPKVAKNNVHVYYVYPLRFLKEKIGISRKTFAQALSAEGFYVAEGYQKPLYLMPMYQKKEIYPNSKFPFLSKEFSNQAKYEKGICPVAERMYEKELLFCTICQKPYTKKEIDLFCAAVKKIEENVEELKKYEKKK